MKTALVLCAQMLPLIAGAQMLPDATVPLRSVSGQFIVTVVRQASPPASPPDPKDGADLVRLEPALLAVSAERVKDALWRELGVNDRWRGQIFLALHPVRSSDEDVNVVSEKILGDWNCRVELPDVLPRTRLLRALVGALLLEFADRNAVARPAEIPAWLDDGLALRLLAAGSPGSAGILLSRPDRIVNGLSLSRLDADEGVADPLSGARQILQDHAALTFQELSWPDSAQLSGTDGGVYRASAQLFVARLLGLPDGPARLRTMVELLPRYYNWQTAFQAAFQKNFQRPLEVEKWWALQVVGFASRDPGPQWTSADSCRRLDEILTVPVEMRAASSAMPLHSDVSLQTAIRNFDPARRADVLQTKLRDLEIAQFRVAAPLAVLTDGYRRAVAGYLGQGRASVPASRWFKHPPAAAAKPKIEDTLKALDALDARRRTIESAILPDVFTTQISNAAAP
jgi:hypothetical protein